MPVFSGFYDYFVVNFIVQFYTFTNKVHVEPAFYDIYDLFLQIRVYTPTIVYFWPFLGFLGIIASCTCTLFWDFDENGQKTRFRPKHDLLGEIKCTQCPGLLLFRIILIYLILISIFL